MKYKNLFLILILLVLSGCSANYTITIDNNLISENLQINNVDINKFKKLNLPIDYEIDDFEAFDKKEEDIDYYNIETKDNSVNIKYNFNSDNFNTSMLFKSCYENAIFTKDNYELLINTSNEFLCYEEYDELDDLTIKINSNYKLLKTNADKIDGHNYYWYINKNNKSNKNINLRLDTTKIDKSLIEIILESSYITSIILIGIILLVILLIISLKKIGERRNKI